MRIVQRLYGELQARRHVRFRSGLACLLLLGCAAPAFGGAIHESLADRMNQAPPGAKVRALLFLREQVDLRRLNSEMAARGMTSRWRRHEYVVRAAQALAARTQSGVLSALEAGSVSGQVASFRPFWVSNTIAVEADPATLSALSLRGDVGMIYADGEVTIRSAPDEGGESPDPAGTRQERTLEDNLVVINAQHAWDLGFTGAGRLVCTFDTGADGNHEAYASRWRGAEPGVPWWAAWKDPYHLSEFPYDAGSHGTHVLGLMVAKPPDQEPLGVAWEAKWISAGVIIGWNVSSIIECFQWAVDPDGDPSTIADVPDVINHSWGSSADCDTTFWSAIDLTEAAGIANVIAVDNSGPTEMSVNSPESRASTLYNTFGVGNLDPHTPGYPINPSSGRGPSPCDSVSIKPEMTAPGTTIYSCFPGDGYTWKTGTSMAAPHVAGAMALLREVNESLPVDSLKAILMRTAQDLYIPGPDNTYGWGMLDVGAAVEYTLAHHVPSNAPRNLNASVQFGQNVFLVWNLPRNVIPQNPVQEYRVYRAFENDPYPAEPTIVMPPFPLSYSDPGLTPGTYRYIVTAYYQNGTESEPSNEATATLSTSDAPLVRTGAPGTLAAGPDPFGRETELRYIASGSRPLSVEIYDASGRKIRTLARMDASPDGELRFVWDGTDDLGRLTAAGAYFAMVREGANRVQRRLVLIR